MQMFSKGLVTTLAGSGVSGYADGLGTSAIFARSKGIDVTSSGTIYIGDTNNARIRTLTTAGLCDCIEIVMMD